MAIFHNGKQINTLYHNGKQIDALYHSGVKIYEYYYPLGTVMYSNSPFVLTGTGTSYEEASSTIKLSDGSSLYMITKTAQIDLSKKLSKCKNGIQITFNTWGLEPVYQANNGYWGYSKDYNFLSPQPIVYLKKSDTNVLVSGIASYAGESGRYNIHVIKDSDTSIKIYNVQESNGTSILQSSNSSGGTDDAYGVVASITAY